VVGVLSSGAVHAGHLLEGHVSLTLELYLTDYQPL
jgi:predicted DNA-binding protein with PD1-like motif